MHARRAAVVLLAATCLAVAAPRVSAQSVTTPDQRFGHEIGADYELPNYTQLSAYWRTLAEEA